MCVLEAVLFRIKKNYQLNELEKIFDENNQGFVYDRKSITDDEFIKYVCVENDTPIGYLVLYPKSDFAVKDDYNISVSIPKNSIYIWHIITRKGYERRGVARTLINYLKKEYQNFYIYAILDVNNVKSNKLHENLGFLPVDKFWKAYKENLEQYTLVRYSPNMEIN